MIRKPVWVGKPGLIWRTMALSAPRLVNMKKPFATSRTANLLGNSCATSTPIRRKAYSECPEGVSEARVMRGLNMRPGMATEQPVHMSV